MRYSSAAALVAALTITGVAAGPTPRHAHHQHQHQKRDVDWESLDWANMGVDWKAAYAAGQAEAADAAAAPAPSVAPPAPSADKPVQAAENFVDAITDPIGALWHGLVGIANDVKAFGAEVGGSGNLGDHYRGNFGSPYGHNMMKVASREGYAYTNEFINTSNEEMTIVIWNKVGPDLQDLSGSALAPVKPSLTFVLAPGASQIVAFQENSQVGFAQAVDEKTFSGAFATSWGELNFVKTGSGYNLSAIMNPRGNKYNLAISSVEAPQCTSDPTQNYWLTDTQPIGGSNGSCYIAQNHATLTTKMGGPM